MKPQEKEHYISFHGSLVTKTRVYQEGDSWRWEIWTRGCTTSRGSGNYMSQEQAQQGMRDALGV